MLALCEVHTLSRLQRLTTATSRNVNSVFNRPLPINAGQRILELIHPSASSWPTTLVCPFQRFYRSSNGRSKNKNKKIQKLKTNEQEPENIDDLKSLMQDKSLSLTAKFKVLFQQYGVVLVIVHCMTAVFWMSLFYFAVSRGFDIVSFLDHNGVFRFLEYVGLPVSENLKKPGASNLLAAYLLYEVAKPVRYPVTIIGTIYAVRLLRRFGYLKRPPRTDTTMRELVQTQSKIVRHHFKSTTKKYQDRNPFRLQHNKRRNGHHTKKNGRKP